MPQPPQTRYPIDDATYDLLVVISSKLEAMHVYERFARDGEEDRALCERLKEDDTRHIDLLVDALRERLGSARQPGTAPSGTGPQAVETAAGAAASTDAQLRSIGTFDWVADRR
jgi:hypothetical protein